MGRDMTTRDRFSRYYVERKENRTNGSAEGANTVTKAKLGAVERRCFAAQRRVRAVAGPRVTQLGMLVFATLLLAGALCFFAAVVLGPIVELLGR